MRTVMGIDRKLNIVSMVFGVSDLTVTGKYYSPSSSDLRSVTKVFAISRNLFQIS